MSSFTPSFLSHLSDDALISSFRDTVISEQELLVIQLDHLAEMDRRKLSLEYPYSRELPHDRITPLTEIYSELRCVVDQKLLELVEDIRGLLAHSHPQASIGELFKVVAQEYRERNHPECKARRAQARAEKKAAEKKTEAVKEPTATRAHEPKTKSQDRFPSQSLEHQMVLSYGYRCNYVDPKSGKRCGSRHALEKDHFVTWADGGKTKLCNLRWLCPGHHKRVSFLRFGESSRYFRSSSNFS